MIPFGRFRRFDDKIQNGWAGTRRQGFWRFVLVRGTISSVFFAIPYLVGTWLKHYVFDPKHAAIILAISTVLGWVLTAIFWWRHEDFYKRTLERRATQLRE
jgi:uncharacterized membrane protein YhaH (DUF805 family)